MIETAIIGKVKVQFLACDICGKRYRLSTTDDPADSANDNIPSIREEAYKNGWTRDNGKDVCVTCRFNVKE